MPEIKNAQEVIQLTKDLITYESTADKQQILVDVLDYIEDYCRQISNKVIIERYLVNQKPSLIVKNADTTALDVILSGHLDVVPGKPEQFQAQEKDGKLFGRGACDMKSGVAASMIIFKTLLTNNEAPKIGLLLTSDEESGGENGTRYLVDELGYRAKLVIVPDGGNGPDDVIIENKGALHLKISTTGKSAHASRPWEGLNALDILLNVLHKIQEHYPDSDAKEKWSNTCSITTLNAGTAKNQVPDQAQATLDIRLTAETNIDEELEIIKSLASDCQVECLVKVNASATNSNHPYLKKYAEIAKDKLNLDVNFNQTPGGNDGRFFSAQGCPLLIVRPLSGGLHGLNEWVDEDGLIEYTELLENLIKSINY